MGTLIYGGSDISVPFDDRTLAHLQIVIGRKLRRRERFFLSWIDTTAVGNGRASVWIDTSIMLRFRYQHARPVDINPEWLELLMDSANTAAGLTYVSEPGDDVGTVRRRA